MWCYVCVCFTAHAAHLYRAQLVAEAMEARTGMAMVSSLELRFQR